MEVRKTRVSSKVLAAHDPFNLGGATGAQPLSARDLPRVLCHGVLPPIASCDAYIATQGVTANSLWSMLTRNDDLPCRNPKTQTVGVSSSCEGTINKKKRARRAPLAS